MRPSEVLKYPRYLKSFAQLDGIENRTLLGHEKIQELLGHIRQGLSDMFKKSGKQKKELAEASQISWKYLYDIDQRGLNPNYATLERILRALGSDTVRFLEELEASGILDVHGANLPTSAMRWKTRSEKVRIDSKFMGERILKIWDVLAPVATRTELDKTITKNIIPKRGKICPKEMCSLKRSTRPPVWPIFPYPI